MSLCLPDRKILATQDWRRSCPRNKTSPAKAQVTSAHCKEMISMERQQNRMQTTLQTILDKISQLGQRRIIAMTKKTVMTVCSRHSWPLRAGGRGARLQSASSTQQSNVQAPRVSSAPPPAPMGADRRPRQLADRSRQPGSAVGRPQASQSKQESGCTPPCYAREIWCQNCSSRPRTRQVEFGQVKSGQIKSGQIKSVKDRKSKV